MPSFYLGDTQGKEKASPEMGQKKYGFWPHLTEGHDGSIQEERWTVHKFLLCHLPAGKLGYTS